MLSFEVIHDVFCRFDEGTKPVLPPIADTIEDVSKLLAITVDFSDNIDHTFVDQGCNLLVSDIEVPDEMITAGRYELVIDELSVSREHRLESVIVVLPHPTNNLLTIPQYTIDDTLYFMRTQPWWSLLQVSLLCYTFKLVIGQST